MEVTQYVHLTTFSHNTGVTFSTESDYERRLTVRSSKAEQEHEGEFHRKTGLRLFCLQQQRMEWRNPNKCWALATDSSTSCDIWTNYSQEGEKNTQRTKFTFVFFGLWTKRACVATCWAHWGQLRDNGVQLYSDIWFNVANIECVENQPGFTGSNTPFNQHCQTTNAVVLELTVYCQHPPPTQKPRQGVGGMEPHTHTHTHRPLRSTAKKLFVRLEAAKGLGLNGSFT